MDIVIVPGSDADVDEDVGDIFKSKFHLYKVEEGSIKVGYPIVMPIFFISAHCGRRRRSTSPPFDPQ
jgi:hypothetical protein